MSTVRLMIFLVVPLVFLVIPVLIGVYVYRDAGRRGMNAVLWTLIAIVSPALIGFIVYLLVRENYSDLECPKCGAAVEEEYVVCPRCGTKLRPACPSCSGPVETDWKVCPRCAAPLEGAVMDAVPPQRRKDRTLGKILIAVIAVPLALILLGVVGFSSVRSSGACSMRRVTFDEYYGEQTSSEVSGAVRDWLAGLELRSDRAYALRYEHSSELDSGTEYFYLIYILNGGEHGGSFGINSGLLGPVLELEVDSSGNSGLLYCMRATADKAPKLRVVLDGKKLSCDVTVVDYNPTLFFIEPDYAHAEPGSAALPERLSVVKIEGNTNVDVAEVSDVDMMLKLLAAIDSGERAPMEEIPEYDFTDGFEIIVEYEIHEDLIMHPEMARHMVFMDDGVCWLNDDRVRNSEHGSSFRVMDEDFYELLEDLFRS